mmetsp:Transcript_62296/g.135318  ORF Transcript_62296/g.135318 Transcript_62296/m.135318 type:complete len:245 (+) Transcript_62296:369-1103(+)
MAASAVNDPMVISCSWLFAYLARAGCDSRPGSRWKRRVGRKSDSRITLKHSSSDASVAIKSIMHSFISRSSAEVVRLNEATLVSSVPAVSAATDTLISVSRRPESHMSGMADGSRTKKTNNARHSLRSCLSFLRWPWRSIEHSSTLMFSKNRRVARLFAAAGTYSRTFHNTSTVMDTTSELNSAVVNVSFKVSKHPVSMRRVQSTCDRLRCRNRFVTASWRAGSTLHSWTACDKESTKSASSST